MPVFEITAQAHSAIEERWRVDAKDENEALALFAKGQAEFISDKPVGEATGRRLAGVQPVEAELPSVAARQPISFEAVAFARQLSRNDWLLIADALDIISPDEEADQRRAVQLEATARAIAERMI